MTLLARRPVTSWKNAHQSILLSKGFFIATEKLNSSGVALMVTAWLPYLHGGER